MAHKSIARALAVPSPAMPGCAVPCLGMLCCNVAHTLRWPSALCHVVTKCSVKRTTKSALYVGTDVGGVLQLSLFFLVSLAPPLPLIIFSFPVRITFCCIVKYLLRQKLNCSAVAFTITLVFIYCSLHNRLATRCN